MTGRLNGRIALIIGGSSGIGLATARRFTEEGAQVFISGRRKDLLAQALTTMGKGARSVEGDVGNLSDLDRLYEVVRAGGQPLDILVVNAAFVEHATLETATTEHFDRTFAVNARGAFFAVQKSLPILADGGAIVLIGSANHLKGLPEYTTYSATKAALRSFCRTWAAELKSRRIRVNMLSPGPIDTGIIDSQFASSQAASTAKAEIASMVPLGRLGRSEEMAAAILFLASDESSYCTGIDLVADGGITQL